MRVREEREGVSEREREREREMEREMERERERERERNIENISHAEEAEHVVDAVGVEVLLHVRQPAPPPRAAVPMHLQD